MSITLPFLLGLASGPALAQQATSGSADSSVVLYSTSPAAWYQSYFTDLAVGSDGARAVFDFNDVIDLETGTVMAVETTLDDYFLAEFDSLGRIIVLGRRGDTRGWFRLEETAGIRSEPLLLDLIPSTRYVSWAPAGDRVAYWVGSSPDRLFTAPPRAPGQAVAHRLPARASTFEWLPDGERILVLARGESGVSTLYRLDLSTDETETIAEGLDGLMFPLSIAISDDGRFAYLPLAGDTVPDPALRHEPLADRDLDIYRVDLASGDLDLVVGTPAEELAPVHANGALHWIAIETRQEVVLVPSKGGPSTVVAEGVQLPYWRPDGGAIGVTFGDWRLADWALNLDGGVIELDDGHRAVSGVEPLIVGFHEDFSPVWSPDGTWIAYHSHRAATPVSGYRAHGSTDDLYVRRPEAPTNEEIRLTDFGREVGSPDWAPDGRRLLIDSQEDGGASVWIIEMNPETGAFVGKTRVPSPGGAEDIPAWGAWSPVREEIALVLRTPSGAALWTLALDGSGSRRLVEYPGPSFGGVDWAADGESIVYGSLVGDRVQLLSISRLGGEPRQLTDDTSNLLHPQVSPDGDWIAATRVRHEQRIMRQGD